MSKHQEISQIIADAKGTGRITPMCDKAATHILNVFDPVLVPYIYPDAMLEAIASEVSRALVTPTNVADFDKPHIAAEKILELLEDK